MAELYSPGRQRLFYKATKDSTIVVTAKIVDPKLVAHRCYTFVKVPGTQKVYYADVDFYTEGIWIAIFYEDGEEKTVQIYNTQGISVQSEIGSREIGPNVI